MGQCLNVLQKINPKWDPDTLFAYDTVKEVKVLDRRLGGIYYAVLLMIIFYIVIYVFMIKQQYLAQEKTSGWTVSQVLYHATEDQAYPFDIFDATKNGEQGAIFIPTRVLITKGQVGEDFCESPLDPCETPEDCDVGDEALQKLECSNGFCMRRQWCPAMEAGTPTTEEHFVDIHAYDIWFSTNLHFHQFALDVGTTDEEEPVSYPDKHSNTYPVHDLLRMAGIDDPETVKDQGVLLNVNKIFDCDLDNNQCQIRLESREIDSTTGFNFVKDHYYVDGGVTKRDVYRFYGIRIFAFATGIGKKTSPANVILQLSSAIALLSCAQTAADVFLQYAVPERRHYVEMKVIQTEDFNK